MKISYYCLMKKEVYLSTSNSEVLKNILKHHGAVSNYYHRHSKGK